jgi:kumamolisin
MSISIRVRPKPGAPALRKLAEWAKIPYSQREYLSRSDFAAAYGSSNEDIQRIVDFARSKGLLITSTSQGRRLITASGTVRQLDDAFAVDLGLYRVGGYTYQGLEGFTYVPIELLELIEAVFGLDQRAVMYPVTNGGNLNTVPLTPNEVAGFYNFPAVPANINTQTIGLMEFGLGGFAQIDINAFFATLPIAIPVPVVVSVNSMVNSPGSNIDIDREVTLDIDVAAAIAPGAVFAVYFSTYDVNGVVQALTTALLPMPGQPTPSVISISYGSAELFGWTEADMSQITGLMEMAANLGVTVIAASGDSGTDCNVGDGNPHVLYPASDPGVLAVGGTSIASSGSSFNQTTWTSTGGGFSEFFSPPTWQLGAFDGIGCFNPDGFYGRGVPDIAGNADPNSGYQIVVGGQTQQPIGGTSAAAPLYAGLVAILNAMLLATNNNKNLGLINPVLYGLNGATINGQPVFSEIADGQNNGVGINLLSWSPSTPGYTSVAGAGWNACTGLGSINGTALLEAFEAPITSGIIKIGSFTLNPNPISQAPLIEGQQVVITLMATDTQGVGIPNLPVTISFTSESYATLTTSNGTAVPALPQFLSVNTDQNGNVDMTYTAAAPSYPATDTIYAGTLFGVNAPSDSVSYSYGQTPVTFYLEPNPFVLPGSHIYPNSFVLQLTFIGLNGNTPYAIVNMSITGNNGAAANGTAYAWESNNNQIQLTANPQPINNPVGCFAVLYYSGPTPTQTGLVDSITVTSQDGTQSYTAVGRLS